MCPTFLIRAIGADYVCVAHPFGMGATVPQQGQASKCEVRGLLATTSGPLVVVLATNRWSIRWWYQSVQAGSGSYGHATATPATHLLIPSNQHPGKAKEKQENQNGVGVTKARIT